MATAVMVGGLSDALVKSCLAPMERAKLILQTQDVNPHVKSGEVPRYSGIFDTISRVYSEQGLAALWAGNGVTVLGSLASQCIGLVFAEVSARLAAYSSGSQAGRLILGALVSIGSVSLMYPLDYAHTRLASDVHKDKKQFDGLTDCLEKTSQSPRGVPALFNGLGISFAGMLVFSGSYYAISELVTPLVFNVGGVGVDPAAREAASLFVASQLSVLGATMASYPFDTVRCRMQMQSEKPKDQWTYTSSADCFSRIVDDEGYGGLFKGAGAHALRTIGQSLVLVVLGGVLQAAMQAQQ